jgi:hypothetical protein
MKVLGVTGVRDIRGDRYLQMLQHATQRKLKNQLASEPVKTEKTELPRAMPTQPASSEINFNTSDILNTLRREAVDPQFTQDQASGTSLLAIKPDINILSHPDAVAQEMIQNLRSSMSISGDASRDITLPEQDMGTSAVFVELQEILEDRFPDLREQKEFKPPKPPADPEALPPPEGSPPDPPPILVAVELPSSYAPPKTSNEDSILRIPPNQMFVPNRQSDLPLQITAPDVAPAALKTEMNALTDKQVAIHKLSEGKTLETFQESQAISIDVKTLQSIQDTTNLEFEEEKRILDRKQLEELQDQPSLILHDNRNADLLNIIATTLV